MERCKPCMFQGEVLLEFFRGDKALPWLHMSFEKPVKVRQSAVRRPIEKLESCLIKT